MRKTTYIFMIALLICSLTLGVFAFSACGDEKTNDLLRVNGLDIVDANGNPVALRGTNAGGWLTQEGWMCPTVTKEEGNDLELGQMWLTQQLASRLGLETAEELISVYEDNWWKAEDFDNVKAMGCNCIRLPFTYMNLLNYLDPDTLEWLSPSEMTWREDAFARIDWFVAQAASRNLYVILDLHGAVGSQNAKHHSGDTEHCLLFEDSEIGKACLNKTIEIWEAVAARYNDNKWVAAYDILNEPEGSPSPVDGQCLTDAVEWKVFDKIYDSIRAVDPNHIVIMEACWEFGALPKPETYGWTNVVYEVHHYNWDDMDSGLFFAFKRISSDNTRTVPLLVGEYNIWKAGSLTGADAWSAATEFYNTLGWHWTAWTYKTYSTGHDSWAAYVLPQNSTAEKVNVKTDSAERIREIWSALGTTQTFEKNQDMYEAYQKCSGASFHTGSINKSDISGLAVFVG